MKSSGTVIVAGNLKPNLNGENDCESTLVLNGYIFIWFFYWSNCGVITFGSYTLKVYTISPLSVGETYHFHILRVNVTLTLGLTTPIMIWIKLFEGVVKL